MKKIQLGNTGIETPQNAFGALPIQRIDMKAAIRLLRRAFEGGITFFDTARAYTDSEEKIGEALSGVRDQIYIASKTLSRTPEKVREDLETSLRLLKTDHLDLYQLHCVEQCYRPGDGTGLYEVLKEAKEQGKILHIGITSHRIGVAEEIADSGLYETLQFPFSYLASDRDIELVKKCEKNGMGFIAMKALSGGLLTNANACMAFMSRYPVLPIWGIQREEELDQWLSFFNQEAVLTPELEEVIEKDRAELFGDFCRGCGYCAPCTQEIAISTCARMAQLIRRMPSAAWLSEKWQNEMLKIETCVDCGVCKTRCPYSLDIPALLRKNLADYKEVLAGNAKV